MKTPAEQFADILNQAVAGSRETAETVTAILAGNVVDGVPVTSATVGALMAEHADVLEAAYGGDDG